MADAQDDGQSGSGLRFRLFGMPVRVPLSGLAGVALGAWLWTPTFSVAGSGVWAAIVFALGLYASILAHEAMHVWLKLNKGFPFRMPPKLEEGLCQVIAYLYLESLVQAEAHTKGNPASVEGVRQSRLQEQEQSLRRYFAQQIQNDPSPVYGEGFREAQNVVSALGLDVVLDFIQQNQALPQL